MSRGGIRRKLAQLQDGGLLSQSEGFWQQPDRKEQMCVLVVLTECMVSVFLPSCLTLAKFHRYQSHNHIHGFFF